MIANKKIAEPYDKRWDDDVQFNWAFALFWPSYVFLLGFFVLQLWGWL